ncbi:hypothetical protein [Olleya namhaensis]|uniref:hypothetical protein n=1 Tax=Olleya namhaensis TaxID=1144750 RepID=UPI00249313AF|nr:hypothetical protein [Olleya namhaensis]
MNKNYILFITLASLLTFFGYLTKQLLSIDEVLINSLAERISYEQITQILIFQKKWYWVSLIISPILLLLKVFIITAIIDAGCFFFSREIKYKKLFNIVVKAEFVFLLVIVFKTVWFYAFQPNFTLEDLQNFYPLSALNIIGYQGLDAWFVYPFQVLNLFEIAYWFILAYLIGKEINENIDKGFSIVASSYGVGLLIWVVGVMFLTLNMS